MGPRYSPTASPGRLRQKKYHRRSARACDECRLRKCKCDGTKPCSNCQTTGIECTYDPKSVPVQKPTLKVRELESRLRSVRSLFHEIKTKTIRDGLQHISPELQALEELLGIPSSSQSSPITQMLSPQSDISETRVLTSMMNLSGQMICTDRRQNSFYGPLSVFAFICQPLELFHPATAPHLDVTEAHDVICELFDASLPSRVAVGLSAGAMPMELPDEDEFMIALDAAFRNCQPLGRLFSVQELQQVVSDSYHQSITKRYKDYWSTTFALLHIVLALSYLFDLHRHQRLGCGSEVQLSLRHFYTALERLDLTSDPSILLLQTLLCIVIYLVNSSRTRKAHPYLALACSVATRLGMPLSSVNSKKSTQQIVELRVFSLLLEFDTYISILLDLPRIIQIDGVSSDDLVATESIGMGTGEVMSETIRSLNNETEMQLARLHMQLMVLTSQAMKDAFATPAVYGWGWRTTATMTVDEKVIKDADTNFRLWMKNLSPVLKKAENTPITARFRPRLETTFYLSQLVLYYPFLHYLIPSASNRTVSASESQTGLSCIKIASTIILRFAKLHETRTLMPACWTTVHAIFLSVLCLMFLIAAHKGTSMPGEAWRRAEIGIKLLAAMRCGNSSASACLNIVRMVITRLKHTVDFDLAHIEATTKRFCDEITKDNFVPPPTSTNSGRTQTPVSPVSRQQPLAFSIQSLLIPNVGEPPTAQRKSFEASNTHFGNKPPQPHPLRSPLPQLPRPEDRSTGRSHHAPPDSHHPPSSSIPKETGTFANPGIAQQPSTKPTESVPPPLSSSKNLHSQSFSLPGNADEILARAQESTGIVDFDMFLNF